MCIIVPRRLAKRGEIVGCEDFRRLRRSASLTQTEASVLLGVRRTTISMWETGDAYPRAELLPKIAELYKCTIDELMKNDKSEPA